MLLCLLRGTLRNCLNLSQLLGGKPGILWGEKGLWKAGFDLWKRELRKSEPLFPTSRGSVYSQGGGDLPALEVSQVQDVRTDGQEPRCPRSG